MEEVMESPEEHEDAEEKVTLQTEKNMYGSPLVQANRVYL